MSNFYVEFKIKRNGSAVSGGILVYETTKSTQPSRLLSPDTLDRDGYARTSWDSDTWRNEDIDVYCHTDGVNRGKPAYVGRVTLMPHRYELSVR